MTEKRLLIDIAGLREAYRNGDLEKLFCIRSQYNVADAMTKDLKDGSLYQMLRNQRKYKPVEQWVTKGVIPQRD